jgi:hypothetical protein
MIRPGFGVIFILLLIVCLILVLKRKEKLLLFNFLYFSSLLGITFIAIQTRWDQLRLLLVFMPLILIFIFAALFPKEPQKNPFNAFLILFFAFLLFSSTFISSLKASAKNLPIVRENIKGDLYYGYTEDWKNYLKLSRWCADSLPPDSYVAVRKAPMSFIYGKGKSFFPIYQADYTEPDSVLNYLKKNGVTHVILASLRRNPNKQDGYIINTIHRMIIPVAQKYPEKLTLIRQEGDSEPAYLYKLNY